MKVTITVFVILNVYFEKIRQDAQWWNMKTKMIVFGSQDLDNVHR